MGFTSQFSNRPLYMQVRDLLVARIAQREWTPGVPLPSEQDLASKLGVSGGTVRKCLEYMERERIITRRQGRGTFVNDAASSDMAIRYSNIRDARGQRLEGEICEEHVRIETARDVDCTRLALRPGTEVMRVERLRRHEGRAYACESQCLPRALFAKVYDDAGATRICKLAQENGILLGRAEEHVSIGIATATEAGALSVDEGTPLLVLDRVIYTIDGRPAEWRLARCHLTCETYLSEIE